MSRRGNRVLALGALAGGGATAFVLIGSALSSPPRTVAAAKAAEATISSRTVSFPGAQIVQRVRPGGLACFTVNRGSSTVARSCFSHLADDEIAYASSRYAVGGFAGADVVAVIVKLTNKGTTWATLRRGAFYAAVPAGHNVRAVVKVLRGGTREVFTVTGSR